MTKKILAAQTSDSPTAHSETPPQTISSRHHTSFQANMLLHVLWEINAVDCIRL